MNNLPLLRLSFISRVVTAFLCKHWEFTSFNKIQELRGITDFPIKKKSVDTIVDD